MGTIRPFDNSVIAWGLRRYGHRIQAARIAAGILDAADFYAGQLPEAFGGYERSLTKFPVHYPTACSPQPGPPERRCSSCARCWIRSQVGEHLLVDPALPVDIGRIELLDIPGRWGHMYAFSRDRADTDRPLHVHPQLGDPAQHHTR